LINMPFDNLSEFRGEVKHIGLQLVLHEAINAPDA
jgi:hypothetical protein